MEEILKSQNENNIIKNINNLIKQRTAENFQPDWFLPTMNLFSDFTNEILDLLNDNEDTKTYLMNKTDFFDNNKKFDEEKFNNFFEEITKDIEIKRRTKNGLKISLKNGLKTGLGGRVVPASCTSNTNEKIKKINFTICNAWSTPFNTIHTLFHELCHALQSKYEIIESSKISNDYLEWWYIAEAQANLFANALLLLKAKETNNENIIKQTKSEILKISATESYENSELSPYFDAPLTENIIENLDYNQFIKNGKINIKEIFDYTYKLVLEKQKLYKPFFEDNNNFEYNEYTHFITIKNMDDNFDLIKDYKTSKEKHDKINHNIIDKLNLFYDIAYKILGIQKSLDDFDKNSKLHYDYYKNDLIKQKAYIESFKKKSKDIIKEKIQESDVLTAIAMEFESKINERLK